MVDMRQLTVAQLSVIAHIRWRIFSNRLRAGRAKFEVFSKFASMFILLIAGLGPAIGIGFAASGAMSSHNFQILAGLLWLVFLAWQFLPTLVVALTESWDTAVLRRFPVSPFTYAVIWTLSGSLDPGSLVAGFWLLAILVGGSVAAPWLAPWITLVLLSFALFNLLLSRLIMAWLSHWLAKRRTREIIGVLFMLVAISNQFIAGLVERHLPHLLHSPIAGRFGSLFHLLPPGLAADALLYMLNSRRFAALMSEAILWAYLVAFGVLLAKRLRAEYFGENLSEGARPGGEVRRATKTHSGIEVLGAPHAVSAVFEKELRALFRSPQFIVSLLLVPPLVLLVFGKFGASSALSRSADLGLAFGLANAMLALTRIVYNNLGMERTGVQFYFVAPVRFRQVVVGKNLAHATILSLQTFLVLIVVSLLFGFPTASGAALAIIALCFAAAVNIAVGNLFSFVFPKKEDFSLNRHRGSAASGFAALGVQFTVLAVAVPLFLVVRKQGVPWLGALVFLLLFGMAMTFYFAVLRRMDKFATKRSEELIAELCRTT